jgi:CheY-like chemotaxis protein
MTALVELRELVQNASMSSKTILVVEDDDIARAGMIVVLEREGYTVAGAANGKDGLTYLQANPAPGLILLDMLMPEFDGWKFMGQLGQVPGCDTIPVIIVTGMALASDEWTKGLGAVGLVTKPVNLETLLNAVRQHC